MRHRRRYHMFHFFQDGNDYGEVFDDMKYIQPQILLVKLQVGEAHVEFTPSLQECWDVIQTAFMEIIKSAENLPRVHLLHDSYTFMFK